MDDPYNANMGILPATKARMGYSAHNYIIKKYYSGIGW
jgi:hypothetical protein